MAEGRENCQFSFTGMISVFQLFRKPNLTQKIRIFVPKKGRFGETCAKLAASSCICLKIKNSSSKSKFKSKTKLWFL